MPDQEKSSDRVFGILLFVVAAEFIGEILNWVFGTSETSSGTGST
jgi:hypothetical protein